MINIREIFLPVFISCAVSLALGYPALLLAKYLNLMDIPDSAPHKKHAHPMPLAGGLLLMASLSLMGFIFRQWLNREILVVLAGAAVIFVFGLWDDAKGLSAFPKIIGQSIAGFILISFGIQVNFIGTLAMAEPFSPFMIYFLNMFFTMFWIIGITNAVNMIDSMDGIVAGLGIITSIFFIGATWLANQDFLAIWSAIFLGINLGLYYWNRMPARFFLGDSGAQMIGFLLAAFGIMFNPLNLHPESSWIVPIMFLSIPIFDTTLVVYSRLKKKQPVGSGRQDHTYHRLIAIGLSPRYAVLVTHLASILISCLAFLLLYIQPLLANLVFGLVVLCGIGILIWFEKMQTLDDQLKGV